MNRKITIYWLNKFSAKTGCLYYITKSIDRAIELFYNEYDKEYYEIMNIAD